MASNEILIKLKERPVIYLTLVLAFAVFMIELCLMLVIERYVSLSPLTKAIVDSTLLVVLLAPLLYFKVFKSMVEQNTIRLKYEKQLRKSLLYDTLTALPNRLLIRDRLDYSIAIAKREKHSIVVILLDVSRLREVNDTLGYHYGDKVLKELAARLLLNLRESDSLARLSGDEFLIVMPRMVFEQVFEIAKKLNKLLELPFSVQNIPVSIEVVMGISIYPDHDTESDNLIQKADIARHYAKSRKESISIYEEKNNSNSRSKLALLNELRDALTNDEFFLTYQPKIDLRSGKVNSVEALVRWSHPERGLVVPDIFIPTIEKTGLISSFTEMTLVKALLQSKQWQQEQMPLKVAVNISARLLLNKGLPDRIKYLLDTYNVLPEMVELEITESAIMANPELALIILTQLHDAGIKLSIDDFGTGFTSLSYLSKLPVDLLKIDRCFIFDMLSNERHAVITNSIIELSHNLGLKVIAEGVEDEATFKQLKAIGCDMIQGYYFSKPLQVDHLRTWRANQNL